MKNLDNSSCSGGLNNELKTVENVENSFDAQLEKKFTELKENPLPKKSRFNRADYALALAAAFACLLLIIAGGLK